MNNLPPADITKIRVPANESANTSSTAETTGGALIARGLNSRRRAEPPQIASADSPAVREAKDALRLRYANGEISREEYLQARSSWKTDPLDCCHHMANPPTRGDEPGISAEHAATTGWSWTVCHDYGSEALGEPALT